MVSAKGLTQLLFIANDTKGFKQWVREANIESELSLHETDKKYAEQLRAEIHFTEFHQFEAFFALMIANFQSLPHWLFLTTYNNIEFRKNVEKFLDNDLIGLTHGMCQNPSEFVNAAIYTNFIPQEKQGKNIPRHVNTDNIFWLVRRFAKKYLNGTEYNAYKHGLRIMPAATGMKIYKTDAPSEVLIDWQTEDALCLLELKKIDAQNEIVCEVSKGFNPTESINHLYFMNLLLNTMKCTRLAYLKNQKDVETLNTFFNLDRESIESLHVSEKWSRPV